MNDTKKAKTTNDINGEKKNRKQVDILISNNQALQILYHICDPA